MEHAIQAQQDEGLDEIRRSPSDGGSVQLIVRRPAEDVREAVTQARIDRIDGLVGDNWRARGSTTTPDGAANPDAQLTLMNARAAQLIARARDRWQLAGDQLFIDLDLSAANMPPGTHLEVGSAIVEVTAKPHLGCQKFSRRFGLDALRFVNSEIGRELRLRGVNARVVRPGVVRVGDSVHKHPAAWIAPAQQPVDA
jgi:hypothetical protein